ncbi:hypothetical protein Tco_0246214 [Tanacetum coccineum]
MEQSSKNQLMNEFLCQKGTMREIRIAKDATANGVSERKNRTSFIKAAITSENQKGKGPDWMFDLDLLTPSMNYIPVRKENYADSKEQGISCDDVEDLDDQAIRLYHNSSSMLRERTAAKKGNCPLKNKFYMMT